VVRWFFCLGGGGSSLVHVGYCGAVNIGRDDLELWLYLQYHVIAILAPLTKLN